MLETLDPHSNFLPPDVFKDMKIDTSGKFGGLGIEIGMKDNVLTVIAPIEDTPAWKAGLKPNDRIVKINNESTKGMTLVEAVSKMRGKKGTDGQALDLPRRLREDQGRRDRPRQDQDPVREVASCSSRVTATSASPSFNENAAQDVQEGDREARDARTASSAASSSTCARIRAACSIRRSKSPRSSSTKAWSSRRSAATGPEGSEVRAQGRSPARTSRSRSS